MEANFEINYYALHNICGTLPHTPIFRDMRIIFLEFTVTLPRSIKPSSLRLMRYHKTVCAFSISAQLG